MTNSASQLPTRTGRIRDSRWRRGFALFASAIFLMATTQPADAASTYLVSYNFENDLIDQSGNGNNGTVGGTVTYATGYTGQGLSLNGTGWVVLPNNIIRNNPNFTVSMRFKTTSTAGEVLLGYQNTAVNVTPSNFVPILAVTQTGFLWGELWLGTVSQLLSTTTVNDGNWHQVVLSGTEVDPIVRTTGRVF